MTVSGPPDSCPIIGDVRCGRPNESSLKFETIATVFSIGHPPVHAGNYLKLKIVDGSLGYCEDEKSRIRIFWVQSGNQYDGEEHNMNAEFHESSQKSAEEVHQLAKEGHVKLVSCCVDAELSRRYGNQRHKS